MSKLEELNNLMKEILLDEGSDLSEEFRLAMCNFGQRLEKQLKLIPFEFDAWVYNSEKDKLIDELTKDAKLDGYKIIDKEGQSIRISIFIRAPKEPDIEFLTEFWQIKNVFRG